jgi:hypothetical protein
MSILEREYPLPPPNRWILVVILLIFLIVLTLFKCESAEEYYQNRVAKEEFDGVVRNKVPREAKRSEYIVLMDGDETIRFNHSYWKNIFEMAKKGDRLIKKKGEKQLFLIPENSTDTVFVPFDHDGPNTGRVRFRFGK